MRRVLYTKMKVEYGIWEKKHLVIRSKVLNHSKTHRATHYNDQQLQHLYAKMCTYVYTYIHCYRLLYFSDYDDDDDDEDVDTIEYYQLHIHSALGASSAPVRSYWISTTILISSFSHQKFDVCVHVGIQHMNTLKIRSCIFILVVSLLTCK